MLNIVRAIAVILGVVTLIIIIVDANHYFDYKMNNTVKILVYLIFIACSIFFSIDGFLVWYKSR